MRAERLLGPTVQGGFPLVAGCLAVAPDRGKAGPVLPLMKRNPADHFLRLLCLSFPVSQHAATPPFVSYAFYPWTCASSNV